MKIGELKAELSKYLRMVRKGGEIIVMDRDTPVAKAILARSAVGGDAGVESVIY